ncbi:MAG: LolA family protein [Acidobacteriota bacterium]
MKSILIPVLAVLLCLIAAPAGSAAPQSSLEEVLSRMDQAGSSLRSMKAEISQRKWTDILEEFDEGETGLFYLLRDKGQIYLRKDIQAPQANSLIIADGEVLFYQPRIRQVLKRSLGQSNQKAEFLLLGFGSDKQALKQAYKISLIGREEMDGHQTYVLELIPRSDRVSAFFTKIVLWVDSERWIPVQQKLVEPTRDYLLFHFQDIQLNPNISKSRFELKTPKGVKVVGQ